MTDTAGVMKQASLRATLRNLMRSRRSSSAAPVGSVRRAVSRELSRLGSEWRILDDIPAGHRGSLEHLLIGPAGVFAVTARHDASSTICLGFGSLLVGDRRVHHGRMSRDDATEVSTLLSDSLGCAVPVIAVVLIVGDRRFAVPAQRDDAAVRIATPESSVRWMRRRRSEWTTADVARIYAAACEPATWSRHSPSAAGIELAPARDAG